MPGVNPNKCSAEELFIAARNMTNELNHKVVKESSYRAKSVLSLCRMVGGWIRQDTDKVKTTEDGNPSIKHWPILHFGAQEDFLGSVGYRERKASEYHNNLPKYWR